MDKGILAEALTALTGVTVKFQSEVSDSCGFKLDVSKLPVSALLGYNESSLKSRESPPSSWLTSWLPRWFIGDQSESLATSQTTTSNDKSSSSSLDFDFKEVDGFLFVEFDSNYNQTSQETQKKESTSSSLDYDFKEVDGFLFVEFDSNYNQTSQETHKKESSSSSLDYDFKEVDGFVFVEFDSDYIPTSQETQKKESTSTSLRKELFVIPDEFFDPGYDFDFTHMSKSKCVSDFQRGNELYKRPYGWMRYALKVRDKYPNGNAWLGTAGWRNHSDPGEWPVSYHGTGLKGAEEIIKAHYKAGSGQMFGRGIYSSPDIMVAEGYSKTFTSQKNGKTYQVIMQNRINPKKRKTFKRNYWLVPIPEGTSAAKEKEIVESSIRPYGLLLKEVKKAM